MHYRAVLFDLGGVVVGSPLEAIARYEAEQGIPAGFVNRVVVATGAAGAWSRLERGELTLEAFYPAFERDCAELRIAPPEAVMLDDIGANLKTARALGMATIRVGDPDAALGELEELLGFPLR